MGLQEKETQKDKGIQEICLKKTYSTTEPTEPLSLPLLNLQLGACSFTLLVTCLINLVLIIYPNFDLYLIFCQMLLPKNLTFMKEIGQNLIKKTLYLTILIKIRQLTPN